MEESREEVMAEGEDQIPREERRKRTRRSRAWEYFTRRPGGQGEDDKAECKRCRSIFKADPKKHGTGHLLRHIEICKLNRVAGVAGAQNDGSTSSTHHDQGEGLQSEATRSTEPSPEEDKERAEACLDLASMILSHGYDSSIVEDDFFKSFVNRINPGFELPSRYVINKMCDRIFLQEESERLRSTLESASGARLSLVVGTTQAVEGGLAIYTAYHFIDHVWDLHKIINNAYMVVPQPSYHGQPLGITEANIDFGMIIDFVNEDISSSDNISRRLFSITWGLTGLPYKEEKKTSLEDTFSDTYPVKRKLVCTTYADDVLHSIARCLYDNLNTMKTRSCFFDPVSEFKLSRYVREELLALLGLQDILTYNEHWYACYCALEILHNTEKCSTGVGERDFTTLLRNLWGAIHRAVRTISLPDLPSSNICLRELFKVREILQSELEASVHKAYLYSQSGFLCDDKNVPGVLSEVKDILDWSIQESYLLWSIPLVLDPRYKLSYIESIFHRAYGPLQAPKYISDITTKLKDIFTDYNEGDQTSTIFLPDQSHRADAPLQDPMSISDITRKMNDILPADNSEGDQTSTGFLPAAADLDLLEPALQESMEVKTELDRYMEDGIVPESDDFDVLSWWKDNSSTYPTVARMARDALAMPTCSKLSSEQTSHVWRKTRGYFISTPGTFVPFSTNIISMRDVMYIFRTTRG